MGKITDKEMARARGATLTAKAGELYELADEIEARRDRAVAEGEADWLTMMLTLKMERVRGRALEARNGAVNWYLQANAGSKEKIMST